MLFSKIAARQVSLRALRAVPQATSVPMNQTPARQFQSGQHSYKSTSENLDKHQMLKANAYKDEVRLNISFFGLF